MKNMRFVRDSGPYKAGEIHSLDDQAALDAFVAGDACNTEEAPNASLQPAVEVRAEPVAAENEAPAEQVETEHAAAELAAPETAAAAAAPETK